MFARKSESSEDTREPEPSDPASAPLLCDEKHAQVHEPSLSTSDEGAPAHEPSSITVQDESAQREPESSESTWLFLGILFNFPTLKRIDI